jgi:hypothetical protein
MSHLWQSSLQTKTVQWSCFTWCYTKHSLSSCLAHVSWHCAIAVTPYPNVMPVCSTRNMKSDLVGKHNVCQKVGFSANLVKHVTGKFVLLWVVLSFQLLQNLNLVCIETQPLSESLMHSCSCHLQFLWSPTNWLPWTSDECHMDVLYLLIEDTLWASSMPFQDASRLQKLVVSCFDPLCVWCCFLINTTKLPVHPHNGLQLRTPHNSHLLLSWRHLCMKWQEHPNGVPRGSLKI